MKKRKTKHANLENKKVIFLEIGFILALSLTLWALEYKSYDSFDYLTTYITNYSEEEVLPPLILKEKEIIPPKPTAPTLLNIVENIEEPREAIEFDFSDHQNIPVDKYIPQIAEEVIDEEPLPIYAVSKKPEFPGGEAAMIRFVAEHFNLPRIDAEQGNSGMIYVQFVIDKEGYVSDAQIIRSISPASDKEALRVVNSMPQWSPAMQSIKKVAVTFVLPIHVRLM